MTPFVPKYGTPLSVKNLPKDLCSVQRQKNWKTKLPAFKKTDKVVLYLILACFCGYPKKPNSKFDKKWSAVSL
jgi:hypothetical protein